MKLSGISSSLSFILIIVLTSLVQFYKCNTISSYIYLESKSIKEELPAGSFVLNLAKELETNRQYQLLKQSKWSQQSPQYTLLEESLASKSGVTTAASTYFDLDAQTGQITTKKARLDREYMCANRQCAEPCGGSGGSGSGSCRLNLKILLMPSFNIVDLNVYVEDIDDNRPQFRLANMTQLVNENVPVGYKIPIDLAHDADVGANAVQRYELVDHVDDVFRLEHNLNASQLFLVVQNELDREDKAEYSLVIQARDSSSPEQTIIADSKSLLRLNIQLVDINDNNPVFEKDLYKFVIAEDAPVDVEVGRVLATDLDSGTNAQIRYSFVDSNVAGTLPGGMKQPQTVVGAASTSAASASNVHFSLNETSGSIRLKSPLDYEKASSYVLTVEARDMGAGSLPAYAHVEIDVVDVNDNRPEITVSFLSTLNKSVSTRGGGGGDGSKYDVFLPENAKTGKFVAHVSIVDRDTGENGRLEWQVWVDGERIKLDDDDDREPTTTAAMSVLKLVKLNQNSFTLNVGDSKYFDREKHEYFDVSIVAWDFGEPRTNNRSVYNFSIRLIDINDNVPRFEKNVYDFYVFENNEPFQVIGRVKAHDADMDASIANLTYAIREKQIGELFQIDAATGTISAAGIRFDREAMAEGGIGSSSYTFHIAASDSTHTATALVSVHVKDVNDNYPSIGFNSTHYHRFHQISNRISSAYFRLGEPLPVGARLVDFRASDRDSTSKFEFELVTSTPSMFRLTPGGQLYLAKRLDKKKQSIHELNVICKDSPGPDALNSTIKLTIEVVDHVEHCIKGPDVIKIRHSSLSSSSSSSSEELIVPSVYINRDRLATTRSQPLFNMDYSVERHFTNSNSNKRSGQTASQSVNRLGLEQYTHTDLIVSSLVPVEPSSSQQLASLATATAASNKNMDVYKLELNMRGDNVNTSNNQTKLMLGKYTVRIGIFDRLNPTCTPRVDFFYLYVGNDFIDENELINLLRSIKYRNSSAAMTFENVNSIRNTMQRLDDGGEDDTDGDDDDEPGVVKLSNDLLFFSNSGSSGNARLNGKKSSSFDRSYLNSDFVLFFILVLVVVIVALLLSCLAIVCIYGRFKKQYRMSTKKSKSVAIVTATGDSAAAEAARRKKKFLSAADEDDYGNEESLNFTTGSRLKTLTTSKKKFLNTSTSSSETNSDELDKPQYTRVHNGQHGSSGSSNTSNGSTLIYAKEDEESSLSPPPPPPPPPPTNNIITSCNGTIRQYAPASSKTLKYHQQHSHPHPHYHHHHQLQQQHRFLYATMSKCTSTHPAAAPPTTTMTTTTSNNNNNNNNSSGYETNRSNSGGGESATTTTIDEYSSSKVSSSSSPLSNSPNGSNGSSTSGNQDQQQHVKSRPLGKTTIKSANSVETTSSAYSSINTSDANNHVNSDSDHSNKGGTNLENFEDALKKTLDTGLLSFKKHHYHHHHSHHQQNQLLLPKKSTTGAAPILANRRGEPTAINTNLIKSSLNSATNSQPQPQQQQHTTRTSFNL